MKSRAMLGAGALAVLGIALAVLIFAAPGSRNAVKKGARALSDHRFDAALASFEEACRLNPEDADALFFRGAALNRLQRHAGAFESLQQAEARHCRNPQLPFEKGWSLVALRRWDEALPCLDCFEAGQPGLGMTSEFRGRALLGLGRLEAAEASFQEALRRDPELLTTVEVYLTTLEDQRKRNVAALAHLRNLVQSAPQSPTGREVLKLLETG